MINNLIKLNFFKKNYKYKTHEPAHARALEQYNLKELVKLKCSYSDSKKKIKKLESTKLGELDSLHPVHSKTI